MSTDPLFPSPNPLAGELQVLRKNWGLFLVLGIVLIIVGLFAISAAFIATLTTVVVFGVLLLIGGGVNIVQAVLGRGWRGFFLHLLAGILYLIVGLLMIENPLAAAAGLTLLMAVMFLVGGLFRIILALVERFHGWGWVLLNGVITLLLGILIWRQWPESSLWVIGLFVGIDLIFAGWAWVMIALASRSVPQSGA